MKFKFTIIILFLSSLCMGQKNNFLESLRIPINSRLDFRYLDYKNDTDNLSNDLRFQFSYFKIDVFGNIYDNLNFRLRYSPVTSSIGTSGISNEMQLANINYVSKNKRWYFELGKSFLNLGTNEEQYNGADVFSWSIIALNIETYLTGVSAEYRFRNGQNVGFQIMNGNKNIDNVVQSLEYNIYWFGKIGDLVNTYFSATAIMGSNESSTPFTFNGGLQWKINDYRLDTDAAVMYNFTNFYTNTLYYSFPIQLKKVVGKWSPYVKYVYNIVNPINDIPIEFNGDVINLEEAHLHTITGGIQYYPLEDKNFRFHLVSSYSFDNDLVKYAPTVIDPGNTRIGYNASFQVILGVRVNFDILNGLQSR